jgi:hypothetical protein
MQRFLNQLIPFVLIGIAIVAFAFGIMLLAYLFLLGALIGLVLFIVSWIRHKFFPSKTITVRKPSKKSKSGQTIDSNDWKEL